MVRSRRSPAYTNTGARGDEMIASYAVLTTQPNAISEPLHDRAPVIIADDEVNAWLDADTSPGSVRALCMPSPSE